MLTFLIFQCAIYISLRPTIPLIRPREVTAVGARFICRGYYVKHFLSLSLHWLLVLSRRPIALQDWRAHFALKETIGSIAESCQASPLRVTVGLGIVIAKGYSSFSKTEAHHRLQFTVLSMINRSHMQICIKRTWHNLPDENIWLSPSLEKNEFWKLFLQKI